MEMASSIASSGPFSRMSRGELLQVAPADIIGRLGPRGECPFGYGGGPVSVILGVLRHQGEPSVCQLAVRDFGFAGVPCQGGSETGKG